MPEKIVNFGKIWVGAGLDRKEIALNLYCENEYTDEQKNEVNEFFQKLANGETRITLEFLTKNKQILSLSVGNSTVYIKTGDIKNPSDIQLVTMEAALESMEKAIHLQQKSKIQEVDIISTSGEVVKKRMQRLSIANDDNILFVPECMFRNEDQDHILEYAGVKIPTGISLDTKDEEQIKSLFNSLGTMGRISQVLGAYQNEDSNISVRKPPSPSFTIEKDDSTNRIKFSINGEDIFLKLGQSAADFMMIQNEYTTFKQVINKICEKARVDVPKCFKLELGKGDELNKHNSFRLPGLASFMKPRPKDKEKDTEKNLSEKINTKPKI